MSRKRSQAATAPPVGGLPSSVLVLVLLLLLHPTPLQARTTRSALFFDKQQQQATTDDDSITSAGTAGATTTMTWTLGGEGGLIDTWEDDEELRLFRRLRDLAAAPKKTSSSSSSSGTDSSRSAAFLDLFFNQQAKEMEEMWSDPFIAHTLLQRFPMFSALPSVPSLAAKSPDTFTKEDGLLVLTRLKAFAQRTVTGLGLVSDPVRLAETMAAWSERGEAEPEMHDLFQQIELGDQEAAMRFHDMVAEETWGGVIDLEAFGKGGEREPEVTAKMRRMVREEEPKLWEMMTLDETDGLVGRLMEDPMYAVELARGLGTGGEE